MGKDKTVKCGFCNKEFNNPEQLFIVKSKYTRLVKCPNCNAVLGIYYAKHF